MSLGSGLMVGQIMQSADVAVSFGNLFYSDRWHMTESSHPGLRGSCGPLPCSFFTSISLLLLRASRIFPKEPLRRREPLHLFLFSDVIVFAKLKWEVINIYSCLKTCWSPAIYSKMLRKSVSMEQNATLGNYWINWQKIKNKQWKCNWKCWSGVLVSFAWKMS